MITSISVRCAIAGLCALAIHGKPAIAADSTASDARIPLIVELFTSQSCSSCPPAEELIERLVREQPIQGVEVIALAEHVDYWDNLGWKDPYSSPDWTQRQSAYSQILLEPGRVYTPEAVIDGRKGVVGSDAVSVTDALRDAATRPHARLQISAQRGDAAAIVVLDNVQTIQQTGFQYWAALLQDGVTTQVATGENGGAKLMENGVIRGLQKMTQRAVTLSFPKDATKAAFRVLVFAQRANDGQIASAGLARVPAP